MQRRYELVDLIVAVGVCATIATGGLLFMAADGRLSVSPPEPRVGLNQDGASNGMRWLQPVLGRAIVDQMVLVRGDVIATSSAMTRLNGVTDEHIRWQSSPFGHLDSIKTYAARAERDHNARVQAVMGRAIVQFTRRGIMSGVLSAGALDASYNLRMIAATEAGGGRMESQFRASWQPNLGRAIVSAGQESAKVLANRQERLGAAIVQLTATQTTYEGVRATLQEQLGGAIMVATRTDVQAGLADVERSARTSGMAAGAQAIWPETPMATIVVASLILMSLFTAGLLVVPRLPGVHVKELARIGPAALVPHEVM